MSAIRHILERKGTAVHSVRPDQTVLDALKLMAEANIGSVLVMSGDEVEGIFTERLYARKVFLEGKTAPTTPVREVMDADVIGVSPEHSTEACMELMTEKRVSHLPVMSEGRLVGLVSIGDLMKSIVDARESRINQLEDYVSGRG